MQSLAPIGAEAANAERAARERQQRAADRARLAELLGGGGEQGGGEWEEGAAAARQLLTELQECFAILDEQQQAQQAQQESVAAAEQAAAAAGLEWEDIAGDGGDGEREQQASGGPGSVQPDGEGLAAYGTTSAANGGGAAEERRSSSVAGGGGGEAEEIVMETLAGLYRQLANRVLPQLADWLAVLGRSEGSDGAQETARQQALREATSLRSRLAAARDRCDALDLDLQALLLRRLRRERERLRDSKRRGAQPVVPQTQQQPAQQEQGQPTVRQGSGQDEPVVTAALQELFGDSDGEEEEGRRGGASPAGPTQQQRREQRGSAAAAAGDEDFESPYLKIVDPAAPRPRLAAAAAPTLVPQPRSQPGGGGSGAAAAGSSLPEAVRRKLAAKAPVLPSGLHTIFWDSNSGGWGAEG